MSPEPQTGPANRIAAELRAAIADGRYQPGAQLPPVRDLAKQYGVSRNTAAKAINILRTEGAIVTRYGSGAYVRESHPIRTLGPDRYARSKWQETRVRAHGEDDGREKEQQGTQAQEVEIVPAEEDVAVALGVPIASLVVERSRTVFRDGLPTHTMVSYYRPEEVRDTPIMDDRPGMAGRGGSFAILTDLGLAPQDVDEKLKARMPTTDEVDVLRLPPGEPVVELTRWIKTAEGYVVEYAKGVHAASRFEWLYSFPIPD
ncbi:GntR family transcriptional regulator [Nonomuraea wenchangensis]|uniref:GntR family transcriptional regulator n=1 Tax=Nonomuraea wenchangensis TaxID=568860 RepID=A0A1I0ENT7_9ACTN|nr:GntR family transcriptional regulator [Nonomuraea wenchangensis]SET47013.1 GntR family transcriptional regulator [Nonomuraea wenchangensis]